MANLAVKTAEDASDQWAAAIRQRRSALMQRLAMAVAAGLIFSTIIGWSFIIWWTLAFTAIQMIDALIFQPLATGKVDRLPAWRTVLGSFAIFANTAIFGSLSVPLWLTGGQAGGVCAVLLLAGGAIYSVVNSPGSVRALVCTMSAHFLYLGLTPWFLAKNGAGGNAISAAAIATLIYAFYCLNTWSRLNDARRAEIHARLDAERKRAEAERIMASRSAFLATVGHDLRTPISAILSGAGQLEAEALNDAGRDQSRLITDAGMMMKALLDDLLEHAKLEAGHLTIEKSDFNLRELLSQSVALWSGPARAKGLKLRVEGAATIPEGVRGDPMRIRQVLNNLISNAMKFTNEGEITLRLRSWADEPHGHAILIEVADTGAGMTPDQLVRLFTPFDQTADGVSARHGGTGLGLAISRQLTELMGGRLTARSRPGEGAVFTLALHLERGESQAAPIPALDQASRDAAARALGAPASGPERTPVVEPTAVEVAPVETDGDVDDEDEGRPMRVLVVDDHDINRRAIQLILQPLGCDIATAADGMAALKICENDAFDLIFMDVRMPELDGRETTRRIRAGAGPNANVPVIAVTADTSPEDIAACTAAGMTYFVPKPITPPMLLGAINHVMSMAQDAASEAA
ncbi:ATP-binding protein [Brevundimonas sp. NPDC092305]|uniref:ATP-binding protein n=1 Tax=Brevundimonas sp. NPDC092305 TaxID=3363957 RepID=UPI00382AC760